MSLSDPPSLSFPLSITPPFHTHTNTDQAPSAAQIRAAITEEARRRGLEHTLREERPPPAPTARHGMLLPPELLGGADMAESMEQLVGLLEHALGGGGAAVQLQGLMQGLAEHSMGGTDQEHDGDDEEEVCMCCILFCVVFSERQLLSLHEGDGQQMPCDSALSHVSGNKQALCLDSCHGHGAAVSCLLQGHPSPTPCEMPKTPPPSRRHCCLFFAERWRHCCTGAFRRTHRHTHRDGLLAGARAQGAAADPAQRAACTGVDPAAWRGARC